MRILKNKHNFLLITFIISLFLVLMWQDFSQQIAQHFSLMANSFVHGRFDLIQLDPQTGSLDILIRNGKVYWIAYPFPAIILMPFVFIFNQLGIFFKQGYLQFFLNLGVFIISYLLSRRFKFSQINSLYLALAVCFGSNYSFAAFYTGSWYYAHSVAVLLLLLTFYEWYFQRRLIFIGIYLGLLLATRSTAIFAVTFFLLEILREKFTSYKEKVIKFFYIMIPIGITFLLLLFYNQIRFGSPWDTGYSNNNVSPDFQVAMLKNHGIFKFENVPTNLYWDFLAFPEPVLEENTYHLIPPFLRINPIGMSFFIMSPIFFLIFRTIKRPTQEQQNLWIGSITVLIPILMWYSTGFWQIGARYILDLFPLLFILLLTSFPKKDLSSKYRIIIIISSLMNLFWIMSELSKYRH